MVDKLDADGVEWRKVLWEKQPFPDNYVSSDFLGQLRTHSDYVQPNVRTLMIWSLPLSQHLCLTLTLVGLFLHLREGTISAETLGLCSTSTIALCGVTMPSLTDSTHNTSDQQRKDSTPPPHRRRALAQPLSYALLALVVLALSPLLKTLTEATTSDSIAALSTALFMLSFALADFSGSAETPTSWASSTTTLPERKHSTLSGRRRSSSAASSEHAAALAFSQPPLPATLSLNAALCASIVLASRLHSPIDVFSLVLSAICVFGFLPRWCKYHTAGAGPHRWSKSLGVTVFLLVASVTLLLPFSRTAATSTVLTSIFFSVVCPAWMRRAQRWKEARRGPWDVGVPRLRLRPELEHVL